jgi:Tol biopolymer transport system component
MVSLSRIAQRYVVPVARLLLASTLAFILPLLVRAGGPADVGDSSAATGYVTARVSVASDGTEGDAGSYNPVISADGRHVAFDSWTDLLVSGDNNGARDVFVHDRQVGQTVRVSVASDGTQGNHLSRAPTISADGRYVAFYSYASNLVPNDNNLVADVFVHDRDADGNGTFDEPGGVSTTRVSVNDLGQEGNGRCDDDVSLSADGRYVAFASEASNLDPSPDTNNNRDVFVHDRLAQTTRLVSLPDQGLAAESNGISGHASISPDGR